MENQISFIVSMVVLFVGAVFLSLSGISYRWRAFTNKRAWDGLTLPFLKIGILVFAIGLIMVYLFYPK